MSKDSPSAPEPSFLNDGENGARRKDVRYRLDGKGQRLKEPLDFSDDDVPSTPAPLSTPPTPKTPPAPCAPRPPSYV